MQRKKRFLKTSHQSAPSQNIRTRKKQKTGSAVSRADQRKKENQEEQRVLQQIAKLTPLKTPRDGIVRSVSSEMAKRPPACSEIANFKSVIRTYCQQWLGYTSKHAVQTYLYLQLNRMLEEKKIQAREEAIKAIRENAAPSLKLLLRHQLKILLRPVEREDLKRMANVAFYEIKLEILALARAGRKCKDESNHRPEYESRLVEIGDRGSRTCIVILKMRNGGETFKVVGLATEAEFKRRRRRGPLRRQSLGFVNRPPLPSRNM